MRVLPRLGGTVTGEVVIRRPVRAVFGFYRDLTNLPRFLGDVVAVEAVGETTYRWTVAGPFGTRVPMTVCITEQRDDELLRYQTCGPAPLRGRWELAFAADTGTGGTRVRERLVVPLGALGLGLLAVIGKFPGREVTADLARLQRLLEAGDGDEPHPAAPPTGSGQQAAADDGQRGTR